MNKLLVNPHPLLDVRAFISEFPEPVERLTTSAELLALFDVAATAPLASDDTVRKSVRDLLRHGGFKPTGRSKPASEYLLRAAGAGKLGSINLAVDLCNAVSLHSGLPISVVDMARLDPSGPASIAIAEPKSSYVFNPAGQVIDIGGLLCLFDGAGPCANAVKDAQRTKTDGTTVRTLSIVWGTNGLPGRAQQTVTWYQELTTAAGARPQAIDVAAV